MWQKIKFVLKSQHVFNVRQKLRIRGDFCVLIIFSHATPYKSSPVLLFAKARIFVHVRKMSNYQHDLYFTQGRWLDSRWCVWICS
jgi:hypothetical protein